MFRDLSNGIEEYTTSFIGFIDKCIDDVVPTVTVRTYPNQKQWITGKIHNELMARAAAFKERETNPEAYKKSRYALRDTIKQAKRQYRVKIESYYTGSDARRMWQSLKTIMDYKWKLRRELPRAYQTSQMPFMLVSRQATLKHAREHQLFWMTM
jgi:hypothetical protein